MSVKMYCFQAPNYDLMWSSNEDYMSGRCRELSLIENYHRRRMAQIQFIREVTRFYPSNKDVDGNDLQDFLQRLLWLHLNLRCDHPGAEHVYGRVFGIRQIQERSCCESRSKRRAIHQVWRALSGVLSRTTFDDFVFLMHLSQRLNSVTLLHQVIRHRMLELYLKNKVEAESLYGPLVTWIGFKCPSEDSSEWMRRLHARCRREKRVLSVEVAKVSSGHLPKKKKPKPKRKLTVVRRSGNKPHQTRGTMIKVAASA